MKKISGIAGVILCLLLTAFSSFAQDLCVPVGWATQNGGTTGGGSATPTVVTTYAQLSSAITTASVKVVHVSGTITIPNGGRISFQDQSGKTVFGLPGSKLVSNDLTKDGSGIFNAKRLTNVIFRNLTFEGPGAYDTDGWDHMVLDNCQNIWVDHCDFQDGVDGNLDVKNLADFISITWCRFVYFKPPIPGGSGGANDHRYSNLFGSSDGATGDRGKLRITMQHCWWAQGVKERMPRVRFGRVHMVNNYFSSAGNNHCIRAGFEADLRVESNYFENVNLPIDKFENNFTAISSINNVFVNTTGNTTGSGTAFTPPYSLTITPAANVKSQVMAAAGATLPSSGTCGTPPVTYTLTTSASPAAGGSVSKNPNQGSYNTGTVVALTATPAAGYTFTGWSGDASGSSNPVNITMNANKSVTANFQVISSGTTLRIEEASSYTSGYCQLDGTIDNNHTGYTGIGFSNADNAVGAGITWKVNATAGTYQLVWRFANGSTADRPATLLVNGVQVGSTHSFPVTSTWTNWTNTNALNVTLVSGTNTIRLTGATANGLANIDWIEVTGTSPTAAPCTAPVTYTMTTSASPAAGGSVSGGGTYNSGAVATVIATAAAGYQFVNWTGDASGTNPTANVTMNSNKSVTANFQLASSPVTIRIEDDATPATGLCLYEGSISTNSGASNGKVINLSNSVGKVVAWRVNVPSAGSYSLNWRYVNSSTSNTYAMKLLVNGITINANLPFPKTSSSTTFSNTTTSVSLAAGNNDIRLESISSNATADIDWIEVTGIGVTAGNCNASPLLRSAPVVLEALEEPAYTLYPNPAREKITIAFTMKEAGAASIRIMDARGTVVDNLGTKIYPKGLNQVQHRLKSNTAGVFIVLITANDGTKTTLKFLTESR